ncbi:hypothetical protein [Homoserinibacter gongjuensis]|uniref:hypothetical protein n=1 Tax=Homoserinibacter gongjuensis TaxID=1162968 RepID=UPI0024E06E40|nr:hypothetical protein [Homoserinibacter gongjuensis]
MRLDAASELLAGAALLVGALVATFSQVAVWRERLLARDDTVGPMRIRALNEAAAHILLGTMASVGATVAIVTLVSFSWPCASVVGHWVQVALSSLTLGLFAYVVVTIMIVINLLWDAYQEEGTRAPRDLDE